MPGQSLFNRDFVLLWQGQLVSQLGHQAYALAMVYWLMEATGSASLMGLLMMVSLLPGVILGPLGGAIADRHSRLRIIVVSDLVRGIAIAVVAAVMLLHTGDPTLTVAVLFGVALFNGIVGAVFQPAVMATVPDLVPQHRLAAANSTIQFSVQASVFIGQAVGGLLYRLFGAGVLFAINAVAYLISAITETFIRVPAKPPAGSVQAGHRLAGYVRDALDGIRFVWQRPGMRLFLLVAAGVNFLAMPVIILLPFYVADQLGEDAAWYGLLLGAFGAGALAGYTITGTITIAARVRPWVVIGALMLTGLLFAALGFVSEPVVALALMFSVGLCTGSINIFVITLFQSTSPDDMRGRVMSLVIAISGVATPLGMAIGGVIGDVTGKNIALIYPLCGAAIGLLTLAAASRDEFRSFLAWKPA